MDTKRLESILTGGLSRSADIRARLTGEPRWLARKHLGRRSLGLEPATLEQIRFQAFLAWAIWGEPTSPDDPGGAASRAVVYGFAQSQGRDYWQIRGTSRFYDNLGHQFVGDSPLPGLVLGGVSGRDVVLRHEPTGGILRHYTSDHRHMPRPELPSRESQPGYIPEVGDWQPLAPSTYRYAAVPTFSDDLAVLLAAALTRLTALAHLSWHTSYEDPNTYSRYVGPSGFEEGPPMLRAVSAKACLLDGSRPGMSLRPTTYAVLSGMFGHPRLIPAGCIFRQITSTRGILSYRDADLCITGVELPQKRTVNKAVVGGDI